MTPECLPDRVISNALVSLIGLVFWSWFNQILAHLRQTLVFQIPGASKMTPECLPDSVISNALVSLIGLVCPVVIKIQFIGVKTRHSKFRGHQK